MLGKIEQKFAFSKLSCGVLVLTLFCPPVQSYAQQCSLPARSLTNLATGQLLTSKERQVSSRATRGTQTFAFLVPNHVYTSGALIVKSRHLLARANGASGIDLKRNGYNSPCTGATQEGYYRSNVSVAKYRGYHFYGDKDYDPNPLTSLNNFHADVRPDSVRKCVRTNDDDIRPQFLYEDDRRAAGTGERVAHVLSDAGGRVGIRTAYANTAYAGFSGLQTEIIPYRKRTQENACVTFNITVPENALKTDIMIVDVEDALTPPISDTRMVPQSQWSINWR